MLDPPLSKRRKRIIILLVVAAAVVVAIFGAIGATTKMRQKKSSSSSTTREGAGFDRPSVAPADMKFNPSVAPSGSGLPIRSSPSLRPQDNDGPPSSAPTISPSATAMPTGVPSAGPTAGPTMTNPPSELPSSGPTTPPTNVPTMPPILLLLLNPRTRPPTPAPAPAPTPTPFFVFDTPAPAVPSSPTKAPYVPIDENDVFRLRLHWEQGYMWQETPDEYWMCVECTECDSLNFSNEGEGCWYNKKCSQGDQLWIQECKGSSGGSDFSVRHVGESDQVRVVGRDLCLERVGTRFVVVERCDTNNTNQHWAPLTADRPFELRPTNNTSNVCMTQHHHPSKREVLGMRNCAQTRRQKTALWEDYWT